MHLKKKSFTTELSLKFPDQGLHNLGRERKGTITYTSIYRDIKIYTTVNCTEEQSWVNTVHAALSQCRQPNVHTAEAAGTLPRALPGSEETASEL